MAKKIKIICLLLLQLSYGCVMSPIWTLSGGLTPYYDEYETSIPDLYNNANIIDIAADVAENNGYKIQSKTDKHLYLLYDSGKVATAVTGVMSRINMIVCAECMPITANGQKQLDDRLKGLSQEEAIKEIDRTTNTVRIYARSTGSHAFLKQGYVENLVNNFKEKLLEKVKK